MIPRNCTDDELAEALMALLLQRLDRETPAGPVVVNGEVWAAPRQETREAFTERFPRSAETLSAKRRRKRDA